MSTTCELGPCAGVSWWNTLVQLPPPSVETSTSAISPAPGKSCAKRICAPASEERSTDGVISSVSSLASPSHALSTSAKGPLPPVWLPEKKPQSGPVWIVQGPTPLLTTDQPGGSFPESKCSEIPSETTA